MTRPDQSDGSAPGDGAAAPSARGAAQGAPGVPAPHRRALLGGTVATVGALGVGAMLVYRGRHRLDTSPPTMSSSSRPAQTPTVPPVSGGASPAATPPAPAATAGYGHLAFSDDFSSARTIDLSATGPPGFRWYTDRPWVAGAVTDPDMISVRDGMLILNENQSRGTWGIATVSPKTGEGQSFQHGYFEARIWFDPALAPRSPGWPAFWSLPLNQIIGSPAPHHVEIDFFEAWHEPHAPFNGHFIGTVHDVTHPGTTWTSLQNSNNVSSSTPLVPAAWHVYGCLWQRGSLRWFLDDTLMTEVRYGPGVSPSVELMDPLTGTRSRPKGAYAAADDPDTRVTVILNTGTNWPMFVDWVRVWTAP